LPGRRWFGQYRVVRNRPETLFVWSVAGSDLRFEDRGLHELKGVPDPWQLFAAVG
jgi:hypothetical protein